MAPLTASPLGRFALTLLVWVLIAAVAYFVLTYIVRTITRRLPGELDDALLGIVRRPLLMLCVLIGLVQAEVMLPFPADVSVLIQRVLLTAIIFVAARMLHRVLMDVVLREAQKRALLTETRLDDVLVAIARLLTPVLIVFVAGLILLTDWGIDIGAALAGAGIIGLVIGLALQETLSNIFAGISILADEPFTPGELIQLPDGKVCRVEHIGLRTTKLYHIGDHSMIYMPNKDLANTAVTNIFKPSYDLRTTLDVGVAYTSNLHTVIAILEDVLCEHPNVLVSDVPQHITSIESAITRERAALQAGDLPQPAQRVLTERVGKWESAVPRLRAEHALNERLLMLNHQLMALASALADAELGGIRANEIEALRDTHVRSVNDAVQTVVAAMNTWAALDDPWALPDECASERTRWEKANGRLLEKWTTLQQSILKPRLETELHLDTAADNLRQWLGAQYKAPMEAWKDPHIDVRAMGASSIDLRAEYFLDDVRLEHFERRRRVNAELMIEVHERFKAHNIEIPFPQMDIWMRSERLKVEMAHNAITK